MALMVCTVVDNTGHSSYLSISTRFTGQLLIQAELRVYLPCCMP